MPFIYLTYLDGNVTMDAYANGRLYSQQTASFNDGMLSPYSVSNTMAVTNEINLPGDASLDSVSCVYSCYEDRDRNNGKDYQLFIYVGTYLSDDLLTDTYVDDFG